MFKHLFRNWLSPRKPATVVRRARPQLERLEDRAVPATFSVTNTNDSGAGSFRQALLDANAAVNDPAGSDKIQVLLETQVAGNRIIDVLSPLPEITDAVDINGSFTSGGSVGRVLLRGTNAGAANGLVFSSQPLSKLENVNIQSFQQNGVVLRGQSIVVRQCAISHNGQAGILVDGGSANNQILNNSINFSGTHGVILLDPGTAANIISGNTIGANTIQGIALFSGPAANQILNNTVVQNGSNGIFVGRSNNNRIQGNRIGFLTTNNQIEARPNELHGICITDEASGNLIGGTGAGEGNTIAFNGGDGVMIGREPLFDVLGLVTAGAGNAVLGNSIFSNVGQGIDLGNNDGPTLNDINDADQGPNNLQNRPFISFFHGTRRHEVRGTLASKPNTTYRIEFFLNSTTDVEGETFVGSQQVTTNAEGTVAFTKEFFGPFPTGKTYSVTATSIAATFSDTSEFSFNTPPMIRNDALTPFINEGQHATLSGNLVDPDPFDTLTLRVNWGDGSPVQEFHPGLDAFAFRHRYLDNGTYNVHFVWLDDQGGSNSRTRQVVVDNVAPELTDLRLDFDAKRLELSGRIVDPGRDSYTLVVHWGDGDTDTYHFRRGTTTFHVNHRYDDPGRYKVRLKLTDDDGGKDVETLAIHLASRGRNNDPWLIALCEFLGRDDRQ